MPALVLVHGGAHAGDCWDLTVDEIHRLAPDLDVLAVDLPGRRGKPGDLRTLTVGELNAIVAGLVFLNGLPRTRRRWMLQRLTSESPHIPVERVSRDGMPDVPRTWILTTRDRSLSARSQRRSIEAIGGVHTTVEMATCHDLMVSEPERLAEILVERCRQYQ